MRRPPLLLRGSYVDRRPATLGMLVVLATLLELAAGAGLAYVAGFAVVRGVLARFDWVWLLAAAGALLVSFGGYYHAYLGIVRVGGGPVLPPWQQRAVVVAAFGGFLSRSGGRLDRDALRSAGASRDAAWVRAASLAGLEQGVLAIGGCVTSLAVLASGPARPRPDVTLPWAICTLPGLLIAFWAAERYRHRFRGGTGWRAVVGNSLDSIHLIRELLLDPRRWWPAIGGMALFWAADAFAVWAGLAAFGLRMNAAALFVGFASGMVFTRRTGPLAGAGTLALLLPRAIWACGAPLAAAVAGVFAYRLLALWLPMPVSLAAIPTLRQLTRGQLARGRAAPARALVPASRAVAARRAVPAREAVPAGEPLLAGDPLLAGEAGPAPPPCPSPPA